MMTPLLIDSRSILKSGFIFVLALMIVFASGFFAGIQRAATIQQTGSVTQPLFLPDQSAVMQSSIEAHPPEVFAAGQDIDVDQPEIKISISKKNTHIVPVPMKITETSVSVDSAKNSTDRNEQLISSVKVDEVTMASSPAITPGATHNTSVTSQFADIETALASDELKKIKYSIQVGTYSRLTNAENMMRELQSKQYATYITDYTTKKGNVRYNVRYGYFSDKKSAVHNLNKFKSDQGEGSDGYLVKFSADNIVDVADSSTINHPADSSTAKEHSVSYPKPAAIPGNISQAEMFPAEVLTKNFTKTN